MMEKKSEPNVYDRRLRNNYLLTEKNYFSKLMLPTV